MIASDINWENRAFFMIWHFDRLPSIGAILWAPSLIVNGML
jgi:hypothetical protein